MRVVLDPGHGGLTGVGASTPFGVRGAGGTLEFARLWYAKQAVEYGHTGGVLLGLDPIAFVDALLAQYDDRALALVAKGSPDTLDAVVSRIDGALAGRVR